MSKQQPERDQEKHDDNSCQPPTHRDNSDPATEPTGTSIYKGKWNPSAILKAIDEAEAKRKGQRHD